MIYISPKAQNDALLIKDSSEKGVEFKYVIIMISCNHPIYRKIIRGFCLFFVPFISSSEAKEGYIL